MTVGKIRVSGSDWVTNFRCLGFPSLTCVALGTGGVRESTKKHVRVVPKPTWRDPETRVWTSSVRQSRPTGATGVVPTDFTPSRGPTRERDRRTRGPDEWSMSLKCRSMKNYHSAHRPYRNNSMHKSRQS